MVLAFLNLIFIIALFFYFLLSLLLKNIPKESIIFFPKIVTAIIIPIGHAIHKTDQNA